MKKQENPVNWAKTNVFSIIAFAIILYYAIIRYNIIKGVPWSDIPIFISNKAIALGAVVFIALSFVIGPLIKFWPCIFDKLQPLRKYFGLLGFRLASVHAFMSLLIFTPQYYPKFFLESGKLNLTGELSMLFGVMGFFIFLIVAISDIPSIEKSMKFEHWLEIQRTGYLAFFFVLLHVFVMGFGGWLTPKSWPGGLLPISLIAFIVIAVTLLLRIMTIMYKN
mgnify:CR=1 FL=1